MSSQLHPDEIELIARRTFRNGDWTAPAVNPSTELPAQLGGEALIERVLKQRDDDLAAKGLAATSAYTPTSLQTAALDRSRKEKQNSRAIGTKVMVAFFVGVFIGPIVAALSGVQIVIEGRSIDEVRIEVGWPEGIDIERN